MNTHRNRVTVCSRDHAFGGALSIMLGEHDVATTTKLAEVGREIDALVYRIDDVRFPANALAEIARRVPTMVLGEKEHLVSAVEANCRGFLLKNASLAEIAEAVETILDGGAVVPPELLGTLLHHLVTRRRRDQGSLRALDHLTDREREVFGLAANGLRKEEIGERLYISPATARTHLQRVYRKLGVHSQSELIALAMRIGEFDTQEEP